MAEAALNEARALAAELNEVRSDPKLTATQKRQRAEQLDEQITWKQEEARDYIERGEREATVTDLLKRSALGKAPNLNREDEWRALLPSLAEFRDVTEATDSAGATVPEGVSGRWVDMLRARSVLLAGLPGTSLIDYAEASFVLPMLASSDAPAYTAEATAIAPGETKFAPLTFDSVKLAGLRWVSNEVLADSAVDVRNVLGTDLLRQLASMLDNEAFSGDGAAGHLHGLIAQGVTTAAAAAQVSYDDIALAVERIWAANGDASIVWCAPDAATALRTAKAAGSGVYLGGTPTGSPENAAFGLPILVSTHIPAGHAVVADGDRVFIGRRQPIVVALSTEARFDYDEVGIRATTRWGGVAVAESSSVQAIAPGA